MYGGIEAGGTKWVCAVADAGGRLVATGVIPTTTPEETIERVVRFFADHPGLAALGIGSFGPVDLRAGSPTYGRIMGTPKPGWDGTDVVTPLREALGVPVALDTDVNAAALGEWLHGAGQGLDCVAYVTVGTGIGLGAVVNGGLLRGLLHPEFGHIRVPSADGHPGSCPFHGDCLEGLASGEAMRRRWGRRPEELEDPAAWELEAEHLAHAVLHLTYTLAPQRIVMGGGVAGHPGLLERVRERVLGIAGGYPAVPALTEPEAMSAYLVGPALGGHSGITGAIELGKRC